MNAEGLELVRYRLDKAENTLLEARLMVENNLWDGAVNRLYYSCFYAVTALLFSRGISSKTHKGVRNLFHINFIEIGIISKELNKFYSELFNARKKSDYEDFAWIDPDVIPDWIGQAEIFINKIKEIIEKPS